MTQLIAMGIHPAPSSRILGLDIIRASAILLVLVSHFMGVWHLGVVGVEMFFVLSGFLIGRILCKDTERPDFSGKDVRRFWRRRWYRTLPNYFACFVVLLVAWRFMGMTMPASVWPYLFFVSNFAKADKGDFFGTSWSLAVEEWAYLLLPLAIFGSTLIRSFSSRKCVLIGAIVLIAAPTLLRMGLAPAGNWDEEIRKVVVFRLDAIGYGVLLAYASMYRKDIEARLRSPAVATLGALGLAVLYLRLGHQAEGPQGAVIWRSTLWLSCFSICLMPVIGYAGTISTSRVSLIRTLAPVVSTYSYSLYLWHLLIISAVDRCWLYHGPLHRVALITMYVTGTCLVSWMAYHLVEKPFMALRNRTDSEGAEVRQPYDDAPFSVQDK